MSLSSMAEDSALRLRGTPGASPQTAAATGQDFLKVMTFPLASTEAVLVTRGEYGRAPGRMQGSQRT